MVDTDTQKILDVAFIFNDEIRRKFLENFIDGLISGSKDTAVINPADENAFLVEKRAGFIVTLMEAMLKESLLQMEPPITCSSFTAIEVPFQLQQVVGVGFGGRDGAPGIRYFDVQITVCGGLTKGLHKSICHEWRSRREERNKSRCTVLHWITGV